MATLARLRRGAGTAPSHRFREEVGDTLVELVVTVMIMSVAVVGIVAGIASAISLSGLHKSQADVSAALVSAAETVKSYGYVPCCSSATQCPTPADSFNTALTSAVAQLTTTGVMENDVTGPTVTKVTDKSGADCSSLSTDPGLEMVWLQAGSNTGKVTQNLYVVVAKN